MKQFVLPLLLIAVLFSSGCVAPAPGTTAPPPSPPATPTPPAQTAPAAPTPPAAFVYDKYSVDAYTRDFIKPNMALYPALFDGVEAFAKTVPISGTPLSQEEGERLGAAVLARFEFNYLYGVTLSPDGTEFRLNYRPDYNQEMAQSAVKAFREQVEAILHEVVHPGASDTENALALYCYFSKATYNEQAEDVGCYGVMVHSEGICTGYAYAMRYLFDQLGIPSHLAFSNDESHVWNLVFLDGAWYHLDATWGGVQGNAVPQLNFFGMTDAQRSTDFDGWYGGGNSNYPHYDLPEATDPRFAFLRDSQQAEADLANHRIAYTSMEGANLIYDILLPEKTKEPLIQ